MIPWKELGRAPVPDGELVLSQRGEEFVIRLRGAELMNSRIHHSEEILARLGCAPIGGRPGARVLIGGLGMGFTVRAALDALGADASVEVAELVPEVIAWNRGVLADLARRPLDDPRVAVAQVDVAKKIGAGPARYDAILLDVDNGPDAFTAPANAALYAVPGLERARRALTPGGVLGVWSVADDPRFTGRLRGVGFRVDLQKVPPRAGSGARHVIWFGRAP